MEETELKTLAEKNKAKIVLAACVAFNLSIGVLYAWSVLKSKLTAPAGEGGWEWTASQAGLPYTVAIIVFAAAMLVGGRAQDRIGPRRVAIAGGVLTGLGIALSGLVGNSFAGITLCFGVMAGAGMGLGYGCIVPSALKWFHPSKKGFVSGLIVGGFGLSAVYFAPLTNALLGRLGIGTALICIGGGVLAVSVSVAMLIKNPPPGYVPAAPAKPKGPAAGAGAPAVEISSKGMLKTKRFYMMFAILLLTASVGLMFIGNITRIVQAQAGIDDAAVLAVIVSLLALVNTAGRVTGGMISDKIGRTRTLYLLLSAQLLNMAAFAFYRSLPLLIVGIVGVGYCFGAVLGLFPAFTADQFGLRSFGANYGIMFMAWGFAGIAAPVAADFLYDASGDFNAAYIICAVTMAAMLCLNFLLQKDIAKR
ncbi:MAG: OFA family MFS transporter [Defluviitaleaceae bacterium]|nr:OFA family MFS transporter [Defluviitaleaceae bacterium]